MSENYHEEQRRLNIMKLRELLLELPDFCFDYFHGISQTTAERTRLGYARDLKVFFQYLVDYLPDYHGKTIHQLTLDDLEKVKTRDIERFLDYVSYYETPSSDTQLSSERRNGETGKARKVAAIRSIFKYFYRHEQIASDPASLIDTPKIHEKNIIRLDPNEMARLLDAVESGEKLTDHQKAYHKSTRKRDLALVSVLLGTGIRVSECVGLNLADIDHDTNGLKVTRKGGNEAIVYFGPEVEDALNDYLAERLQILPAEGHEEALFLSMQKKRISVRAVEDLVRKYSLQITSLKKISPHKLRSSYGTALYTETGDIYLVADVLGHKDVNTTRKHYAQMQDSRRRKAAGAVILRKEADDPAPLPSKTELEVIPDIKESSDRNQ